MVIGIVNEVLNQISKRQTFILTSHARPDGDAVGSALACCQILRSMGKQANVVLSGGVPVHLSPTTRTAIMCCEQPSRFPEAEAAIILECDSVQRTCLAGLDRHYLINIDHHATAQPFADVNWIDPNACATAEMIFRLARMAGVRISPDIATCLYTAVVADTGSFCFHGTTERTFSLAQELVRCGADPVRIAHHIYFSTPISKMLCWATPSPLCTATAPWRQSRGPRGHRALRSQRRRLRRAGQLRARHQEYEVALFFREQVNGSFRVSLRSKGAVNVAAVATAFGGGEHECASGCGVDGPLSAATERVVTQLRIRARPPCAKTSPL